MMFLVDTNIFLEILLDQEKSSVCKDFLQKNYDRLYMTDFTLHSIGVILFKMEKADYFSKFVKDIKPNVGILTLSGRSYETLAKVSKEHGTDFDDTYQYLVAKEHELKIVTFDKDFGRFSGVNVMTP